MNVSRKNEKNELKKQQQQLNNSNNDSVTNDKCDDHNENKNENKLKNVSWKNIDKTIALATMELETMTTKNNEKTKTAIIAKNAMETIETTFANAVTTQSLWTIIMEP